MTFYEKPYEAMASLSRYVRAMDPEKNDAVVYGAEEMIANAKLFLDQIDRVADDHAGKIKTKSGSRMPEIKMSIEIGSLRIV